MRVCVEHAARFQALLCAGGWWRCRATWEAREVGDGEGGAIGRESFGGWPWLGGGGVNCDGCNWSSSRKARHGKARRALAGVRRACVGAFLTRSGLACASSATRCGQGQGRGTKGASDEQRRVDWVARWTCSGRGKRGRGGEAARQRGSVASTATGRPASAHPVACHRSGCKVG